MFSFRFSLGLLSSAAILVLSGVAALHSTAVVIDASGLLTILPHGEMMKPIRGEAPIDDDPVSVAWQRELQVPMALLPTDPFEYVIATLPDRGYGRTSRDVKYTTLGEEILTLPMRQPQAFHVVVATLKTWAADLVVQLLESRKRRKVTIDRCRSFAFATFGCIYVGFAQWGLYVSLMTYLAPNAIGFSNEPWSGKQQNLAGQQDLLRQVLLDNFIFNALIYFPIFYVFKEFWNSHFKRMSALATGLRKYRHNFFSDNAMSMMFWVPGDCVAFAAPMCLRLPVDHFVSFTWTMVLSYHRGNEGNFTGCSDPWLMFESGSSEALRKRFGVELADESRL